MGAKEDLWNCKIGFQTFLIPANSAVLIQIEADIAHGSVLPQLDEDIYIYYHSAFLRLDQISDFLLYW